MPISIPPEGFTMSSFPWRMQFGAFMAPFHTLGDNPGLAIERDVRTIQWLDELRFDEAWVGEHHSAGWETISSPEVFIAYAAAKTRSIRLGTGVVSLPYHNPYHVAERMVLLDQLTRGRVMLGVGPGALPSDAYQFVLEPARQRPQMDESLGIIMRLLAGEEVTYESDWIHLRQSRLQAPLYSESLPVFVASTLSPAGPTIAGKHGAGLINVSTFLPAGLDLRSVWEMYGENCEKNGHVADRRNWRLMLPIYIAETREEAWRDVSEGAYKFQKHYFDDTLGRKFEFPGDPADFARVMALSGGAIIGTPDDAVEAIQKIWDLTGGFGGLLGLAHEWALPEKLHRSYELFARYVMPKFQGSLDRVTVSHDWAAENREALNRNEVSAVVAAFNTLGTKAPDVVYGEQAKQ
ncbi:MAG TPA: LLM class flavin-dependent oxidoreductase [Tepidiformaceae bacterium]|nr:LLM class flavin-dependent oxidoreductase [Tepidiformaceae bacterium]